jgi:predicted MFS family arabinose efflux permease
LGATSPTGNAGGAFLGGAVIDAGLGLGAVNWAGALVSLGGVLVTVLAVALDRGASAAATEMTGGVREGEQTGA